MTHFNGVCKKTLDNLVKDMDMFNTLEVIKGMAREYHKGQRYGAYDYFEYHVMSVYKRTLEILWHNQMLHHLRENNIFFVALVSALFHDVLEDTWADEKELRRALELIEIAPNVIDDIIESVIALTKNKGETRAENVQRIIATELVAPLIVKYADSSENYSNSCVNAKMQNLAKQYFVNLGTMSDQLYEFDVKIYFY